MIVLAVTIVIEDLKDGTAQNPSLVYAVLSVYVVVAHALFTADAIIGGCAHQLPQRAASFARRCARRLQLRTSSSSTSAKLLDSS